MKRYNLIQVGSFDVENFGDLLFPIVFEYEMKKRLPLENLYLFSPKGGVMPFYNRKVYPASEMDIFCAQNAVDGIVIGGGDTVRLDKKVLVDYPESFFPSLSMWQYPILVAAKYRIPSVFNCPGAPIDFGSFRNVVDDTLRMSSYITVRDDNACSILIDDCGSLPVKTVMDTVSLIDEVYPKDSLTKEFNILKKRNKIEDQFLVLQANKIQIDDSIFTESLINLIRNINEQYDIQVVLSPIGYVHDDLACLKKIYSSVSPRNVIIEEKMHPRTMVALFSHSIGFIGTSLHGLVVSNAYKVPILAIDTQSRNKIAGYMHLCGYDERTVTDISAISDIFNSVFFNKVNRKKFLFQRKKIHYHFDKIADIIKNRVLPGQTSSEADLLCDFYELCQPNSRSLAVTFVSQDGEIAIRHIPSNPSNHFVIKNNRRSHTISIALAAHPVTKIRSLNVFADGRRVPANVINCIQKPNDGFVYLDPNIIIENTNSYSEIVLEMDFDLLSSTYAVGICDSYNRIINSIIWRRTRFIRSIIKKLAKLR